MKKSLAEQYLIENFPWHLEAFSSFIRYIESPSIPSGLIIEGQKLSAKTDFALLIAQVILCQKETLACFNCPDCQLVANLKHPNLIEIGLEEGSKQIKLHSKKQTGADIQIADLISLLTYKENSNKVVLINPAETINLSAANALLKTLEELGENKHIIFITHQSHRLPATIRSRCHSLRLSFKINQECEVWWLKKTNQQHLMGSQREKALKQFHQLLLICNQSIYQSFEYFEKINLLEDYWQYCAKLLDKKISAFQMSTLTENWDDQFLVLALLSLLQKVIYHKVLSERGGQSSESLHAFIDELFTTKNSEAMNWLEQMIHQLSQVSLKNLIKFYKDTEKAYQMLSSNANIKLLFDNLFTIFSYLIQIGQSDHYPDTFEFNIY